MRICRDHAYFRCKRKATEWFSGQRLPRGYNPSVCHPEGPFVKKIAPHFLLALLAVLLLQMGATAQVAQPSGVLNDPATDAKVETLLKQMTLEEKIGQMNQFSYGAATGPGTGRSEYGQMITAGKLGSVFNLTGAMETNKLQRVAMTQSRLKIPLIFGLDVIHGYRTTFSIPLALAATWDPELVQRTATVAAQEVASWEGG